MNELQKFIAKELHTESIINFNDYFLMKKPKLINLHNLNNIKEITQCKDIELFSINEKEMSLKLIWG